MNTQVIEFLTNTPNSNKTAISEATGIKGLPLFNLLKSMMKDGQIVSAGEGNETTYALTESKPAEKITEVQPIVEQAAPSDAVKEETPAAPEPAAEEEEPSSTEENKEDADVKDNEQQEVKATPAKATSTRDNTKYSVNGEGEYGKGPLVRAVLELHLKKNPTTTFKQLKELFPDTLMKRFGVFEEITKAKDVSGKTDRYFMKTEHVFKTGDKKSIVVCSQWTSTLIVPFIEVAKKLGYKIK